MCQDFRQTMHVQSLWFWGFGYLLPISSSSKLWFGDAAGNIWWLLLFKERAAHFWGALLKSTLMQITDHRFHDDCSSCWSDNSSYKWQIVLLTLTLSQNVSLKAQNNIKPVDGLDFFQNLTYLKLVDDRVGLLSRTIFIGLKQPLNSLAWSSIGHF